MVNIMKSIKENEYQPYMGILIDVRDPISYKEGHNSNSINIYYDKLLMNHKTVLDKDKGHKSKQAARILSFYGYNVTYVINS